MGHMITLKEQEVFAEELRTILQDRLLQTDAEHFLQEERLVMMFKLRFSDLSIVQCEIMLKDMQDSRKIHKEVSIRIRDLQAKILSRSIWPDPEDQDFNVPTSMQDQTNRFSEYYGRIKPARKLKWQLSRGRVDIELNFEDRTFREEVTAAQAAVINEFADNDHSDTMQQDRSTRTCAQLQSSLGMDDTVLRSCLSFWVSKRILLEHAPPFSSYSVIESLESLADAMLPNQANAQDAAVEAAQAAQEEPEEELLTALEQMNADKDMIYGPIRNMLSTQGAMATTNMFMFMKMVSPDGFPYEEEDFEEFMRGLEEEGLVAGAGGMWQLPEGEDDDE
jgi:anaphase-promoting complex subunit 2